MHDFSVFRTVSGPYDVPLDDPKPRFGQQRRKNRPRPCCRSPFLYNFTLDFKGNILKRFKATPWHIFRVCWMPPPQAQLRPMPWSCAHPSATMCTAAVCSTFFSTCPHLSLIATCRRDLVSSSRRCLGEAEAWFQRRGGGQTFFGQDTGPRQVWSHREAGLPPIFTRCMLVLCASAPMSSHIPLQCARVGLMLGASVGALSSRCDTTA